MSMRSHNVAIRVGQKVVEKWSSYDIESNMLEPADGFTLTLGKPSHKAYHLVRPDAEVQVLVDDVTVLTGYIEDRDWTDESRSPTMLTVTGRDKASRLLDDAAPFTRFAGLGVKELVQKMATPWFTSVVLSNAENRRILRGPLAPKVKVSAEPALVTGESESRSVQPGEMRWDVIQTFLDKARVLAWATADGKSLFVGLPNYDQDPSYKFFVASENSDRKKEANVKSCKIHHSTGERYSAITCVGTPRDDGEQTTRVYSRETVRNGPNADGTGKDFASPKRLFVADDAVRSTKEARTRAELEMARRDSAGHTVKLQVRGHSQLWDRRSPALYAIDTMARFEHEETGISGLYLITRVRFSVDKQAGEVTDLDLVPKGSVLV